MPFSPAYRAKIEKKLGAVVPIESRVMFGGVAFYSGGLLFALVDDDKLYFKVDDSNREDFEEAGMKAFVPYPGSKPMGYWELPKSVYKDDKELGVWIDKALQVAKSAKAKKKPSRAKRQGA